MRRIALAHLLVILNACALSNPVVQSPTNSTTVEPDKSPLLKRSQSLAELRQWSIVGRMSIRTADEVWAGKLRWQQFILNYKIFFDTPTGQGAISIRGDEDSVVLETAQGQSLIGDDEESLLYDQLGWELPLDDLRQWILGAPEVKNVTRLVTNENGQISELEYANWHVKYLSYQHVDTYELPKKVFITGNRLKLRLVIDKWVLANAR